MGMNPDPLGPGLALRNPISRVQLFSTKTQLSEEENFVPTKEGLTVELDTALLYRIDSASAPQLLQSVGERFADVIIKPEVRSIVRGLTSKSEAKALYTSGRDELQRELKAELADALKTRGIIVEDFLLKAIKLPDQLVRAIELKAQAEQDRGAGDRRLPEDRQRWHQSKSAEVERHRGHGEAGEEPELENSHHGQLEGLAACDPRAGRRDREQQGRVVVCRVS